MSNMPCMVVVAARHSPGPLPVLRAEGSALRLESMLLVILETVSTFPEAIPDVDFVVHSGEVPCIRRKWAHGSTPVPIFGRQGSVRHHDIPLPDFGLWAGGEREEDVIRSPFADTVAGWREQYELLRDKYSTVSTLGRIPQALWRGSPSAVHPDRNVLRSRFARCAVDLQGEGRAAEAALFNSGPFPRVALQDSCDFRFSLHIEGLSHDQSLRHRLACGSLVVAYAMEYWEWWSRALVPGEHYVRLTNEEDHICNETAAALTDLNTLYGTVGRQALKAGRREPTPTLRVSRAALLRSPTVRPLLRGPSQDSAPIPRSDGTYSWNSDLTPWAISWNGQDFMRMHVRTEDTITYTRDALRAYAALQRFVPRVAVGAQCYTGAALIDGVARHSTHARKILQRAYPWLENVDTGCASAVRSMAGAGRP